MKKRVLSLTLVLSIALSLFPTMALAASGAADPIKVYVTISDQGGIPVGENDTLMAKVPVKVTDLDKNGSMSYDEAMVATHKAYYEGADVGYNASNDWVTKLWGETNGVGGFYRNDQMIPHGVNTDTVADGDYLVAFVYADQDFWSDEYSYFDQTSVLTETGENVKLTLKETSWGVAATAAEDASIVTVDARGGFEDLNQTTDSNGNVTVSFNQAGTYVVSAYGNDTILAPPVCIVTVNEAGTRAASVKNAISNCVSGYQGSTCAYGAEWALLGRVRALSGAEGWTSRDADITNYVGSVEKAIRSGKMDKDTVPTTIERVILALTAVGVDPTNFCGENLTAWLYNNKDGIANYASNDLIWALIALDSWNYTAPDGYRDSIVSALKQYQNTDGGFFYSQSWNTSEVDMTAMALIALNPYQNQENAKKMIQAGLSYMNQKLNADSGYGNSCTDAYAVIALCTLNQPGEKLNGLIRTMLTNYLDETGFTYDGKHNGMATYEGLLAMDAYQRLSAGEDKVFDLSDLEKEAISVTKPTVSGTYTYTAGKQTVKISKSDLYTLSGTTSATEAGTYTVTASLNDTVNTAWADGSTEDVQLTWSIVQKSVSKLTYSSVSNQTYTGKELKPGVTVKNSSKKLTVDTDYTITYSNNTNIGTAEITITGRGNYTGTKTLQFKIVSEKETPTNGLKDDSNGSTDPKSSTDTDRNGGVSSDDSSEDSTMTTSVAKTGDNMPLALFLIGMSVAGGGMVLVLLFQRKRKN